MSPLLSIPILVLLVGRHRVFQTIPWLLLGCFFCPSLHGVVPPRIRSAIAGQRVAHRGGVRSATGLGGG